MRAAPRTTFVLGGARSGKSRFAEGIAAASARPIYVATATAGDAEMAARIAEHRARRDARWTTIDAPIDAPDAIRTAAAPEACVLVDCLTLWLTNLILGDHDLVAARERLLGALNAAAGPVALVANEVGLGLVPDTRLGRTFRDAAGVLNQAVAARCDRVVFVAAGLPLVLKGDPLT